MKKLWIIIGLAVSSLFVACSASVHTPVGGAGAGVGSTQQVHTQSDKAN